MLTYLCRLSSPFVPRPAAPLPFPNPSPICVARDALEVGLEPPGTKRGVPPPKPEGKTRGLAIMFVVGLLSLAKVIGVVRVSAESGRTARRRGARHAVFRIRARPRNQLIMCGVPPRGSKLSL
jgi:hypothetical protein